MNNYQNFNNTKIEQTTENGIVIFIKNPQLGKVKTRLAATLGNERALEIYHSLMTHTQKITNGLSAQKFLYYSDFINENDIWSNKLYQKSLQHEGQDLGLKMAHAFRLAIRKNCKKALIIGSDCLELTEDAINDAFLKLADNEVVIGPANDGGYYLIGFNFEKIGENCREILENVFLNKEWSHEDVCQDAINACKVLNLKYSKLPTLIDIDDENDLRETLKSMNESAVFENESVLQKLMNG